MSVLVPLVVAVPLLGAALLAALGHVAPPKVDNVVAIAVSLKRLPVRRRDRSWIADVMRSAGPDVATLADTASEAWREEALRLNRAFAATRLERERAIAAVIAGDPPYALQPGLFDRRADTETVIEMLHKDEQKHPESLRRQLEILDEHAERFGMPR